jgi:hypothetical protein
VGATRLQMLANHVNVLEGPLQQMILVDRGCTGGIVQGVDHLYRQPDTVRGGNAQRRSLAQADIGHAEANIRAGWASLTEAVHDLWATLSTTGTMSLDQRLITQHPAHCPRALGAWQLSKYRQGRVSHSQRR